MFETHIFGRGDVMTIAGEECTKMYIVDEGDVGIFSQTATLQNHKKLSNIQLVDFVVFINAALLYDSVFHYRR